MNALAKLNPVPLGDRTIEAIREAIISGELAPGEPLRDRDLAERLGVSRTPIREALHRLEAAGLVEARHRSGWAVSLFTEQDVREVFQLRRLLEPAGVDEMAKNPDPDRIAQVASAFTAFSHPIARERYPDYFVQDNGFHKTIVDWSNNSRIRGFYEVLDAHINRGRFFLNHAAEGRLEETLDEHHAIIDALTSQEFERAKSLLLAHLRTGEELMIRQLRQRTGTAQA